MRSPSTFDLLVILVPFVLLAIHVSPTLSYTLLSNHSLQHHIPPANKASSPSSPDPDFDPLHGTLLAPLLTPRVPGTPGHARVQHHFASFVRAHLHPSWTLEWHNTTAATPATGDRQVPFQNLILRRDPPWTRPGGGGGGDGGNGAGQGEGDVARLTLAAHYDSLYRPEGFVGATDSAVPCAVLLFVARAVDEALTRRWQDLESRGEAGDGLEEEKGVQILLLDGEEAWVQWSDEDSLYGSR
jgi:hypothetical protein